MARDRGFPLSGWVSNVKNSRRAPDFAVLIVFVTGSLLVLFSLISDTAFNAITSISTIGFQVSYVIPILLRITISRKSFPETKFSLGKYSFVCGVLSAFFLISTSILFLLPSLSFFFFCIIILG